MRRTVRSRALGVLLLAAVACGGSKDHSDASLQSCDAITERLDGELTRFRASLDDACVTAEDCTGVRYAAARGDVTCLESDFCFLPVSISSADALAAYLATDARLGALCVEMDAAGCALPIPDCGPVEPACEQNRCNLVAVP